MACSSSFRSNKNFFYSFILVLLSVSMTWSVHGHYTSIISFGDSLADTGNLVHIFDASGNKLPHIGLPPYGETFFHRPTGRCSNGRLIIDFLAESLNLPLIPPYVGGENVFGTNFRQGVNFAVAGATALDASFHEERGTHNAYTNVSLGTQLEWFKQLLPSICSTPSSCREILETSLILMGEIGGNDYNHALTGGKSMDEVQSYVSPVVNMIASTITELIELGAVTIVVPGNLPIGCSAAYLTIYDGAAKEEYDTTTGCLIGLNEFAEYHNELLVREINRIREHYPHANIIYADYYNAAMQFFRSPKDFGFSEGALKACCGGGGPYNYNTSIDCANPQSTVCDEPDLYANWDGLHLTEAAYRSIFKSLFQGPYTTPQFKSLHLDGGYSSSL